MLKKIIAVFAAVSLICCIFAACGNSNNASSTDAKTDDGRLSIVCTVFPLYDWVQNILGDNLQNCDFTLLLDSGIDLHSYQTTAEDMMKIASADVFIYIGGSSDSWVSDVEQSVDLSGVTMVNASELLGPGVREEVAGLEPEEEENESETFDEHIWLSLKNAQTLVPLIAEKIGEKDTDNAVTYKVNSDAYVRRLASLDSQYQTMVDNAKYDTIVFADRFPFVYLFEDYGIKFVSAFTGCSTDTNASPNTILKLAESLKAAGNHVLMITETGDGKIADTVIESSGETDVKVLTLNALQSVTSDKIGTTTYLDAMQENLSVLTEALS